MSERRASAVLDHIDAKLLHNRRPARHGLSHFVAGVSVSEAPFVGSANVQQAFVAKLEVGFKQWVNTDKPGWHEHCVTVAKRAIARELYGGVLDRLLDIRQDLHSEGMDDLPVYKMVYDLAKELDGTMRAFE